jgi:arsenate reductase (glutaredoxin)
MIVLYGIKNCDTVNKARKWLNDHGIEYHFHDYRKDGLTLEQLQHFAAELGWNTLLNRSSTSWRQLSLEQQSDLSESKALNLMFQTPTLIKRPILNSGGKLLLGFKPEHYQNCLA